MHPRVTELFVKKWREQKHRKLPGCSASRGFEDAVDARPYVFDLRLADSGLLCGLIYLSL